MVFKLIIRSLAVTLLTLNMVLFFSRSKIRRNSLV